MTPKHKKTISRIAIVGAFLMAISCTVKITLFHLNCPEAAQWVNVIMNAIVVCGCYELGKITELSLSHRLLCGTAILGYLIYGIILLFFIRSKNEGVSAVVLGFFIFTMIMSVWFFIDLVLHNLRKDEDKFERLKKELKNENIK